MKLDLIQHLNKQNQKNSVAAIKVGDVVRVHTKIIEGAKERIQVFEGVILGINGGKGVNATFTVRKISSGVGVERVFPFHSPRITKIEVKRRAKVRRAKLNYLRGLSTKKSKLKELQFDILAVNAVTEPEPEIVPESETVEIESKSKKSDDDKIDEEITELNPETIEDEENISEESVEEIAKKEAKESDEIHEVEEHTVNDETNIAEEEIEEGLDKAEDEDTKAQG